MEGGWAEVCTEEVEIHHTADIAPYIEHRLWDDRDIPMLARMADRIMESVARESMAVYGRSGTSGK